MIDIIGEIGEANVEGESFMKIIDVMGLKSSVASVTASNFEFGGLCCITKCSCLIFAYPMVISF